MKKHASIGFVFLFFLAVLGCGGGGGTATAPLVPSTGTSNPSIPVQTLTVIPPTPDIIKVQAFTDHVVLNWSDTSLIETGFSVERDGTEIAKTARNVNAWSDTTVKEGTTYCYAVRSFNIVGQSDASPQQCVMTPAPAPTPTPTQPHWILPVGAQIRSLAVDQTTGELYVAGGTDKALTSAPSKGMSDAFLAKIGADGSLACVQQWGTETWDSVLDISLYHNEAYALWSDVTGAEAITTFDTACKEVRSMDIGHLSRDRFDVYDSVIYLNGGTNMRIDHGTVSPAPSFAPYPFASYTIDDAVLYNGITYYVGMSAFTATQWWWEEWYVFSENATNGAIQWVSTSTKKGGGIAFIRRIIAGSFGVYSTGEYGLIVHHDLAGNLLWTYQDIARTSVFSHIVADDTAVYAMGTWNGGLTKINNDGTVAWRTSVVGNSIALFNTVLFVAVSDGGNAIARYDALTGKRIP